MITGISHITFIVKNLDRTANLFKKVFDAKEIYTSEEKKHSLYKEKFFLIGNQWIAIMESEAIVQPTNHHIAIKIVEQDVDIYLKKIKNLNLELKPPRQRMSGEGYSIYFHDYDNNLFELHTGTLSQRLTSYEKADNQV